MSESTPSTYLGDWSALIAGLVNVVKYAPEMFAGLQEAIGHLRAARRDAKILVLGPTGSGKSAAIGNVLLPRVKPKKGSTKETMEHLIRTEASKPFIVADTPGDLSLIDQMEEQLHDVRRFLGVINFTSFGYLDSQAIDPIRDDPQAYVGQNEINPEYLERQRAYELEFLDRWLLNRPWVKANVKWVITAVSKYDLWAEHQDQVLEYYFERGKYGRKVAEIVGNARYVAVPVCGTPKDRGKFRRRTAHVPNVSNEEISSINGKFIQQILRLISRRQG